MRIHTIPLKASDNNTASICWHISFIPLTSSSRKKVNSPSCTNLRIQMIIPIAPLLESLPSSIQVSTSFLSGVAQIHQSMRCATHAFLKSTFQRHQLLFDHPNFIGKFHLLQIRALVSQTSALVPSLQPTLNRPSHGLPLLLSQHNC